MDVSVHSGMSFKIRTVKAIYEMTSGKYNTVYLEMYKKGKMKNDGYNLLVCEPVQKGDKVIVLQMHGRAWVYKARE